MNSDKSLQQSPHVSLIEHPLTFASRKTLIIEFATWLETHDFQMHVTANFNRETTHINGRNKLKTWSSRLERKLFGSRYFKKSPEDRMFFVAIPETGGFSGNLHYHMLVRLPRAKHELFELNADAVWKNLNPTGSLFVQKITETRENMVRVINYDLKETWTKNSFPDIVISTEFKNSPD